MSKEDKEINPWTIIGWIILMPFILWFGCVIIAILVALITAAL